MTRLPATLTDPSLRANPAGSDARRKVASAEVGPDFYATLLANAPLAQLTHFTSGLSLEHLTPLRRQPEPLTHDIGADEDRDDDPKKAERPRAASANSPDEAAIHFDTRLQVDPSNSDRSTDAIAEAFDTGPRNVIHPNSNKLVRGDQSNPLTFEALEPTSIPASVASLAKTPVQDSEAGLVPEGKLELGVEPQTGPTSVLEPAVRSEGFPTAAEVIRRNLAARAAQKPEDTAIQAEVGVVGEVELAKSLPKAAAPETQVVQVENAAPVFEKSVPVDAVSKPGTSEGLVQGKGLNTPPVDARVTVEPLSANANTENAAAVDLDANETVEISFKADAPVVQKSDRSVARGNRKGLGREERSETSVGTRPGGLEQNRNLDARADRMGNLKLAGEAVDYGLDEIPVLPTAQRAFVQFNQATTAAAGTLATAWPTGNELEMPGQLDGGLPSLSGNTTSAAGPTSIFSGATMAPVAASGAESIGTDVVVEGAERTPVPSRLLNQVAQALKQVPAGDSTMRLQLNPVELGQMVIEISFRDGVMHGKLRAEQGQTVKMLQEGIEGLRARLSDQGIVVQTLEVELGRDGDFTQQNPQRSFSQSQEFGQQRQSSGYFSGDGQPKRHAAPTVLESETLATNKPQDGRWAVNVIV